MKGFKLPETFLTERIECRRHRREEAEEMFYAYASKPAVTQFLIWPTHACIEDTRRYIRYAAARWDSGLEFAWTIRLKPRERLIGSIGLVKAPGELQVGYVFSPTVWGLGLAGEALGGLLDFTKGRMVEPIVSYVHPENLASIRVLENAGFSQITGESAAFIFPNLDGRAHTVLKFRLNA